MRLPLPLYSIFRHSMSHHTARPKLWIGSCVYRQINGTLLRKRWWMHVHVLINLHPCVAAYRHWTHWATKLYIIPIYCYFFMLPNNFLQKKTFKDQMDIQSNNKLIRITDLNYYAPWLLNFYSFLLLINVSLIFLSVVPFLLENIGRNYIFKAD